MGSAGRRLHPARVILGFLIAPLAGAAFFAVLAMAIPGFNPLESLRDAVGFVLLIAMYGAYPPALLLGVPAYFVLRNWVAPKLHTTALVGGVIACIPWLWAMYWPGLRAGVSSQVGTCVSEIDGVTTWCGHMQNLKMLSLIFLGGVAGGAAFWLCVVWRDPALSSPSTT
jgi:hypothetical protein